MWLSSFCFGVEEVARFEIDAKAISSGEKIDLNGQWWFTFGEHTVPLEVREQIRQKQMESIYVPQSWNATVEPLTDNPYQHGIATYALPIGFSESPEHALSVFVSYIVGGYRLYWLSDDSNEAVVIGTSGDWQTGDFHGLETDSYHFSGNSNGLLIAHVAKKNLYYGGIRHPISIQRSDVLKGTTTRNIILRSIFIGSMLIMGIHYLIQYYYMREKISTLLLALLCFAAVLRGVCTSGFIELFLLDWLKSAHTVRIKLEFMSILFLPVIYLIFLSSILPKVVPKQIIRVALGSLVIGCFITLLLSTTLISKHLLIYQLYFGFWAIAVVATIIKGAITKSRFAHLVLISTLIVGVGGINDVIASRSSFYHVYLAEYVFFIFLFFQAQLVGMQLRYGLTKSVRLSEEKRLLQQAHTKAVFASQQDHLTGLYNRLGLTEKLAHLAKMDNDQIASTGVILFDLDHFKRINDAYGHDVGDEILIFVASLLHGYALRVNDFKCRYGGEEFLLILPGASLEKTQEIAEDIRSKLEQAVAFSNAEITLQITASLGVAVQWPNNTESLKDVISRADIALYQAKDLGRNCVVVDAK